MANVNILKVGRALVQGARGTRGGAPSKDSIWGIALINTQLVTFFGRTGGILRYKTLPAKMQDVALETFQTKLTKPFKTTGGEPVTYSDITKTFGKVEGLADLAGQIGSDFFKAGGRVNRRATAKTAKAGGDKAVAKKETVAAVAGAEVQAVTPVVSEIKTEPAKGLSMSKDAIRKREKRAAAKAAAGGAANDDGAVAQVAA